MFRSSCFRSSCLAVSLVIAGSAAASAESPLELLMKQQQRAAEQIASAQPIEPVISPVPAVLEQRIKPVAARPPRPTDALIQPVPKGDEEHNVHFVSDYEPGTLVIDTSRRALFRVLNANEATKYKVAVGKQGFEWTGTETISSRAKWPDWRPPAEMRQRDPSLPELVYGGRRNPLGARALYLGDSLYRIHGTWKTKEIGLNASSGCIRMHNAQVAKLYDLVEPGKTKVVVTSGLSASIFANPKVSSHPLNMIDATVTSGITPRVVPLEVRLQDLVKAVTATFSELRSR